MMDIHERGEEMSRSGGWSSNLSMHIFIKDVASAT